MIPYANDDFMSSLFVHYMTNTFVTLLKKFLLEKLFIASLRSNTLYTYHQYFVGEAYNIRGVKLVLLSKFLAQNDNCSLLK